MTGTIDIKKTFTFEAAHFMAHMPEEHAYRRYHGHSFEAEVTLTGKPDPETGWIADFAEVEAALAEVRADLDHRLLNEVPGLGAPTLERLAMWIAERLASRFPALSAVEVRRPTCGQSAVFRLETDTR